MKRFFFYLSVFCIAASTSYSQNLFSLRASLLHLQKDGYGINLCYSHQIREKLFLTSELMLSNIGNGLPIHHNLPGKVDLAEIMDDVQIFSLGLKYCMGNNKVNPYIAPVWGLIRRKGTEKITYPSFDEFPESFERGGNDIHSYFGLEFGTFIELSENFKLDFCMNAGYSKLGEMISLNGGVAYQF